MGEERGGGMEIDWRKTRMNNLGFNGDGPIRGDPDNPKIRTKKNRGGEKRKYYREMCEYEP